MSIDPLFAKYAKLDDVALLGLYRGGDQSACAALIARYAGIVNHRVSFYSIKGAEKDDLKQEAFMGLLSAIRSFDEGKKAGFFTYANHCISNRLKNLLINSSTKKATVYNQSISFEDLDYDISKDSDLLNPEFIFIQNEGYHALVDLVNSHLSPFEKEVLFLYLNGFDYLTVSQKLNSSQKSVGNALQRARKKLKTVLNNL